MEREMRIVDYLEHDNSIAGHWSRTWKIKKKKKKVERFSSEFFLTRGESLLCTFPFKNGRVVYSKLRTHFYGNYIIMPTCNWL